MAVEHVLARLAGLGIGQARYFGRVKTGFQLLLAATVANLRRTWNWQAQRAETASTAERIGRFAAFWRLLAGFLSPSLRCAFVRPCDLHLVAGVR